LHLSSEKRHHVGRRDDTDDRLAGQPTVRRDSNVLEATPPWAPGARNDSACTVSAPARRCLRFTELTLRKVH
jgi:hypothetical protein